MVSALKNPMDCFWSKHTKNIYMTVWECAEGRPICLSNKGSQARIHGAEMRRSLSAERTGEEAHFSQKKMGRNSRIYEWVQQAVCSTRVLHLKQVTSRKLG